MLKKIRKTIDDYKLVSKGDRIIIGVSGGPDSVALLLLLNRLKQEFNLMLYIGHLDHMLRPDSSADANFVKELADKLKLPVFIKAVNLKSLPKNGSIEQLARLKRIEFLVGLANKLKADKIALAHNLDDQAETVLMRILRGTGLYGLAAIMPKRLINGVTFIRPLIEVKRQEIERYLKHKAIQPRIDTSNFEEIYLRNKIRHKLLPFLESNFNPNIKESLANLAQNAGIDYDYLRICGRRFIKNPNTGLSLKKLFRLHPAILRIVIREKIDAFQGNKRRITFQHIREIEDLLFNRPKGSIVDLPKGIQVKKSQNFLQFIRR